MRMQVNDLEERLSECYRAQAEQYELALETVMSLRDSSNEVQRTDHPLSQIQSCLDRVAQIDEQAKSIRAQWESAGCRPGGHLSGQLKRVQGLIEQLIGRIDEAEQAARKAKERLMPRLDDESRRRKMRSAYTSALKHS